MTPPPPACNNILDVSAANVLNYPSGSYAMVAADVAAHDPDGRTSAALLRLRVADAFACRRELINTKKMLLHVFAAGRAAEADAARVVTYYWRDEGCVQAAATATGACRFGNGGAAAGIRRFRRSTSCFTAYVCHVRSLRP